jgi:twitching motility two-component system response regulator PilG
MGDPLATDSLQRGIETAKSGNKLLARLHLLQAVEAAPQDPNCWLWLAWVAESPGSAMHSLERILEDHPDHELAQLGMRWAKAMAEFDLEEYTKGEDATPAEEESTIITQAVEESAAGAPEESCSGEDGKDEESRPSYTDYTDERHPADEQPLERSTEHDDETRFESEPAEAEEADEPDYVLETQEGGWESDGFEHDVPVFDDHDGEDETILEDASEERPGFDEEESEQQTGPEVHADANSAWCQEEPSPDTATVDASFVVVDDDDEFEEEQEAGEPAAVDAEASSPQDDEPSDSQAAEPALPELPAAVENSGEGVSVLVVDDSPTVRKLVTMTLEKNGFTVGAAADGVVALKSIAELKPRLILLDITMPRLGGYQLCKLIKKHESTKHIPVIMLSGKDGMFDKVRGKFVGCDDYITKPFDPEELVSKVTTQLSEHYGAIAAKP